MSQGKNPFDADELASEFDRKTIQHDWERTERPSIAVVEAVAATTGRKPTDLPPLQEYVDTDALDALMLSGGDSPGDAVRVTFPYHRVTVTVDTEAGILVQTVPRADRWI